MQKRCQKHVEIDLEVQVAKTQKLIPLTAFLVFFQERYIMYFEAQIPTRRFFFTVSPKVLGKVVERERERESRIRTE